MTGPDFISDMSSKARRVRKPTLKATGPVNLKTKIWLHLV